MGLFDRMKKKFEDAGSDKKVANVVDDKKKKKDDKKKTKEKPEKKGALTSDEIKRAQAMESGTPSTSGLDKPKDKKKEKKEPRDTKAAYKVLIRPVFTEKASYLSSSNSYVFEVHPSISKPEIKKAVFAVYKVDPISVRIMNVKGKDITFGRISGKTKNWKKAIVTLPQGKTIDVYQN